MEAIWGAKGEMEFVRINCNDSDWRSALRISISKGREVDLLNFNHDLDASYCEAVAAASGMTFRPNPPTGSGHFLKNQVGISDR